MENFSVCEKQLEKLVAETLSEKRFQHVANVASAAKSLALRFNADIQKAAAAAWLHDIAKEKTEQQLLEILSLEEAVKQDIMQRPVKVWHGPAGALFAKHNLNCTDAEILDSIFYHTTGRANMTKMDKIIYLADMISAERDFEDVREIREIAEHSLDVAVHQSLVQNVAHVKNKGYVMDNNSLEALEWYDRNF